jgi:NADH-quinone oxidoreductase subunit M
MDRGWRCHRIDPGAGGGTLMHSGVNAIILTALLLVPVAGALLVTLMPRRNNAIQWTALLTTLVTFGLSLHLPVHFSYGATGFQFAVDRVWIANPQIHYHVGVDGLSLWLVLLTTLLVPIGVLVSWRTITERTKEFYALFLLQQTAMLGVFIALDLIVYYAFWELSIVPMALLIGMFGRNSLPGTARGAAIKFFLYAFIASMPLLVAMLWLYARAGTFDFVLLQQMRLGGALTYSTTAGMLLSLAFLVAFAVKVPIFPLHGWLADALSVAPTAAAMILAGKLGLYSILRFSFGLFPSESRRMAPVLIALGVIGILDGALIAWVQTDLKRLASYSTLSHLGFCVLGIFSFTAASTDGGVYQILNHGVSAGTFFILLGILYDRFGTYDMAAYGGVAARLPYLATMMVITALSLIGLPILNGFVGEFLVLSGSFAVHSAWTAAATLGVILSAVYMLSMVQRVFYAEPSARVLSLSGGNQDIRPREQAALWPLLVLIVLMGVMSPYWMRAIDQSVGGVVGAKYILSPEEKRLADDISDGRIARGVLK